MSKLRERIQLAEGEAVKEMLARLEAGEGPARLGVEPLDVVAAMAVAGLGTEEGDGPALVQRRPARPGLVGAATERSLADLFPNAPRPVRLAMAAGLLQILDAWDASHEAAQEADDLGERATSAYWHGIAHRREPDPGNASYWFRRIGRHPVFAELAAAAGPIVAGDAAAERLVRGGSWDPSAFINYCGTARAGSVAESRARRLQRLEMLLLLDRSAAEVAPT